MCINLVDIEFSVQDSNFTVYDTTGMDINLPPYTVFYPDTQLTVVDEYEFTMPDGIEGEFISDDPLTEKFSAWAFIDRDLRFSYYGC